MTELEEQEAGVGPEGWLKRAAYRARRLKPPKRVPRPNSRVIGPFLGYPESGRISIFIGLPDSASVKLLHCELSRADSETDPRPRQQATAAQLGSFRVFGFSFESLEEGASYRYRFLIDGNELQLEGGLQPADCWFRAPGRWKADDSFILMSCHGPFQKQAQDDMGWA